jgi:hypothetical protein
MLFHCSPEKCKKAQVSFDKLQPVIDAITIYSEQNGIFPDSLGQLTPKYLEQIPSKMNDYPVLYSSEESVFSNTKEISGYELGFSYSSPGMNHCSYQPTRGWKCFGYY